MLIGAILNKYIQISRATVAMELKQKMINLIFKNNFFL